MFLNMPVMLRTLLFVRWLNPFLWINHQQLDSWVFSTRRLLNSTADQTGSSPGFMENADVNSSGRPVRVIVLPVVLLGLVAHTRRKGSFSDGLVAVIPCFFELQVLLDPTETARKHCYKPLQ